MSEPLSTDALLAYMSEQAPAPTANDADLVAYEDAAAVLAAIQHPDALQPFGEAAPGAAVRVLGPSLIPATGRKFAGRVMLEPDARYRAISRLASSGRLEPALAPNPDERTGPIQEQFEAYLLGKAPALEDQTLDQLDATRQVAVWVRDAVPGIPDPAAVERRAAYRRLLQPFERIAGDDVFRGRKKELDELRAYVGVLEPASILKRLQTTAFKWPEGKPRRALDIYGPGGVGKSALVARFMLEHTRVPDDARIPFAYLDFDRLLLDIGDPFGLVVEMLRQVDTQFPGEQFSTLRSSAEARWASAASMDEGSRFEAAQSLLGDVLAGLGTLLGPRPYVVVLDTFEEVQYRGEARAFPLWEMLGRLQERWPFLRVIISGRAPVDTLRLAGEPPQAMLIGSLDEDAATAFMQSQGVKDPALARRLVRQYGGVPLSLKLVASLFAKDPAALDGAAPQRGALFQRANDELIQGQLYERVLGHISDERVRRLAHPGLVLRRITPELIFEVLNGPCQLGISSPADAASLFEDLGREASLVSVDPSDGSLVHRSDLRRVMLKLLVASEPARVERIRRAAVAFYDRRGASGGLRATAEAAYHRLHLGEPVAEDTLKDPEVRASLQPAVVEMPLEVQQRLATLGYQVPPEAIAAASRELQEQSLAARVEEYLPNGPTSEAEAARVLASTPLALDHASPLFRAAARVALQGGRAEDAAQWIGRGLEEAATESASVLTLRLLQEQAWLEHVTTQQAQPQTLDSLADYAARHEDVQATLEHRLLSFDGGYPDVALALAGLASTLTTVAAGDLWALVPATRIPVREALSRNEPKLIEGIRTLVLDPSGPFRYAGFSDRAAQRPLDDLLNPNRGPMEFGQAWEAILDAWPYRILFVAPPLGRRGEELYESAV